MSLASFLLIAALVLFVLAAISVPSGRVNLLAAGLACAMGAALLGASPGIFG